ncbi:MAG: type III-B CRISPR module-associated Cmr3 family protein [Gammaproteobacteria bacterium]
MSIEYRFVQPVDTVSIRGNKLFGDPGSISESSFPPKPSVLAGAFRSYLLTKTVDEIGDFSQGKRLSDGTLHTVLGTIHEPGDFSITDLYPARRNSEGKPELFMPLPADVWVFDEGKMVRRLEPQAIPQGIRTSQIPELPFIPVLRQDKQAKPESGWLLNTAGIGAYLSGDSLQTGYLEKQDNLWATESRVGIGLTATTRTADEGKLFTVNHTVVRQSEHKAASATGLLVGLSGCHGQLQPSGFIRLGGDGRAARFSLAEVDMVDTPLEKIKQQGRFKMILHTPGLFNAGWLPDATTQQGRHYRLQIDGFSARLCCAAISRYEVISGWDLANWRPKVAERVVPAGSAYWFDEFEGDASVLSKLVKDGLWPANSHNTQRRAEGYNRIQLACWSKCKEEKNHV